MGRAWLLRPRPRRVRDAASGSAPSTPSGGDGRPRAQPPVAGPSPLDVPPPPLDVPPPPSARRLDVRAGEPTVPVRLMENRREVTFVPGGRVRLFLQGEPEKMVEAPGGTPLVVRWLGGTPADRALPRPGHRARVGGQGWHRRRARDLGGPRLPGAARAARAGLRHRREGHRQPEGAGAPRAGARRAPRPPTGRRSWSAAGARAPRSPRRSGPRRRVRLRLDMADGTPLGTSEGPIRAEAPGGEGFEVRPVEFAVGYPNHGFETAPTGAGCPSPPTLRAPSRW